MWCANQMAAMAAEGKGAPKSSASDEDTNDCLGVTKPFVITLVRWKSHKAKSVVNHSIISGLCYLKQLQSSWPFCTLDDLAISFPCLMLIKGSEEIKQKRQVSDLAVIRNLHPAWRGGRVPDRFQKNGGKQN